MSDFLTLTSEPTWPWSIPILGPGVLGSVLLLIVCATLWGYRRSKARGRRLTIMLALRLLVVALMALALLRPALAFRAESSTPSILLIACDKSESMTIQDEFDGLSRWQRLRRVLKAGAPLLESLREKHQIEVVLRHFSGDVGEFDPKEDTVKADGRRSDYGNLLHSLYERYRGERRLRGLIILGDGTDNGTRHAALPLAAKWRSLPCPISTFAFGKPTTGDRLADIALTAIQVEPAPVVRVKSKMTVRATVDAPGFENRTVKVRLLFNDREVPILDKGREAPFQEETLRLTTSNEIRMEANAPGESGEVKVTIQIEPLKDELATFNNQISTFATVSRDGISVLLIDKARYPEPVLIARALAGDPRLRLFDVTFRNDKDTPEAGQDLFRFTERAYDVVILGDITPGQLSAGAPGALKTLRDMVETKRTGLLFLGGYNALHGAWKKTPLGELLPVDVPEATAQADGPVTLSLTARGRDFPFLRLVDDPGANAVAWSKLTPLDGANRLGTIKSLTGCEVLVESAVGREPMLATREFGSGRVLTFAGDTTWRWIRPPQGHQQHARFWRQMVLWLARQEEAQGNAWVRLDTRRLTAGGRVGFTAGLRGKGGRDLPDARFEARVAPPQGPEISVPTAREKDEERGSFVKTDAPGEYRLILKATGREPGGEEVSGETSARFLVVQEDTELVRRAADHEFLRRLAAAGGGTSQRGDEEEFVRFLEGITRQSVGGLRPRSDLWPDWKRPALSGFLPGFLTLFALVAGLEWYLRRRWGLV